MKLKHIFAAAAATALVSCNDYLDTIPNKGNDEVINNSAQVEALLGNSSIFNTMALLTISSSDDYGMTTDIASSIGWVDESLLNGMTWNVTDLVAYQYGDQAWSTEYNKVFTANLVINSMDEVDDLTPENRTEYLAQAHMVRAMAMWNLVNTYCLPYSASTLDGPGLPLKQTTSYEESMARATLKETYEFILNDLDEAYKTANTGIGSRRWWVSRPAVAAMKARYYLFTQDYDNAIACADEALGCADAQLEDYNGLGFEKSLVSLDGVVDTVFYSQLYRYSDNEIADYCENYFSEYFTNEQQLIPSETLTALYDTDNDLRYSQFFNDRALWESGIGGFGDDVVYNKFSEKIQMGPTVPEVMLTKAEALARKGQWQDAMNVVNQLRQTRYREGSDYALTVSGQQDAVLKIIDERHREMPFVMRWFDIRRLGFNDVSYDDVTVERTFYDVSDNSMDESTTYKYTLPAGSARYAQPIVGTEVSRSQGVVTQNEYPDGCVVKELVSEGEDEGYDWE